MVNFEDDDIGGESTENIVNSDTGKLIVKSFETILADTDLTQKFSKINDLEEMYNFCSKIISGFDFKQFKNFIMRSLTQVSSMPEPQLKNLLYDEISGGQGADSRNNGMNTLIANSLASDIKNLGKMFENGEKT